MRSLLRTRHGIWGLAAFFWLTGTFALWLWRRIGIHLHPVTAYGKKPVIGGCVPSSPIPEAVRCYGWGMNRRCRQTERSVFVINSGSTVSPLLHKNTFRASVSRRVLEAVTDD